MLLPRLSEVFSWLLVLVDVSAGVLRAPKVARLGITAIGVLVAPSAAVVAASLGLSHFTSPDATIKFDYPADFVVSEKPLKTHGYEAFLKSEARKGYNEGITVSHTLHHLSECALKILNILGGQGEDRQHPGVRLSLGSGGEGRCRREGEGGRLRYPAAGFLRIQDAHERHVPRI